MNDCLLRSYFLQDLKQIETFKKEVKHFHKLSHPNLLEIKSYFIEQDLSKGVYIGYLQFPFFEEGILPDWIERNQPTESQLQKIFIGILRGLEKLHENGLLHGSLKPQTVLMSNEGIPKITEYDLTKEFKIRKQTILTLSKLKPNVMPNDFHNYISPEVFTQTGIFQASDMYNFGLILYDTFFQTTIDHMSPSTF